MLFAERTLHRALTRAAELLQSGEHTVKVFVAQGAYNGKAGQGTWVIPAIDNPAATLHILGGYNDDFSGRQPFSLLSVLVTAEGYSHLAVDPEVTPTLHRMSTGGRWLRSG